MTNVRLECAPSGEEALAGCRGTSGQSLQVKVEPEPVGLALLGSSLTSLPSRSLPPLGSNQPWFCCSYSEEPFNNTTGGWQDWGWELLAQALPATTTQLPRTVPGPSLFINLAFSEQSVPGHKAGDLRALRRAGPCSSEECQPFSSPVPLSRDDAAWPEHLSSPLGGEPSSGLGPGNQI